MTLRSTGHPVQFDGASQLLSFVVCPLLSAICLLPSALSAFFSDFRIPNSHFRILSSVLCPLFFLAALFLQFAVRSLIRFFGGLAAGLRLVCLSIDDELTL
jgi:hypothetical protein